jgi:hypothetical protein
MLQDAAYSIPATVPPAHTLDAWPQVLARGYIVNLIGDGNPAGRRAAQRGAVVDSGDPDRREMCTNLLARRCAEGKLVSMRIKVTVGQIKLPNNLVIRSAGVGRVSEPPAVAWYRSNRATGGF